MTPKERVEATADGVLKKGTKPLYQVVTQKVGKPLPSKKFRVTRVIPKAKKSFGKTIIYSKAKAGSFVRALFACRRNLMPERHHPVKAIMAKHGLIEALLERKPFRPNSFQKSKMTEVSGVLRSRREIRKLGPKKPDARQKWRVFVSIWGTWGVAYRYSNLL